MKTISFKFKCGDDARRAIDEDSRICSAMRRFAFKRYQEGKTGVEINKLLKDKFVANSILRASASRDGSRVYELSKSNGDKVHFGQFRRFQRGLIDKEEYKTSRNTGILCEGEANVGGNRLFKIDVQNNKLVYKRWVKEHYDLEIAEKLTEKRQHILSMLQLLMTERKTPVTVRIKGDTIYLTYDESVVEADNRFKNLFQNRVLGIDLNPNYFGISIIEFKKDDTFKVLYKECIDLTELQKQSTNKIKFELYQVNHHILKLCKCWHVGKLAVEDLSFDRKKKFWNPELNKLCRNQFRFKIIKQHLETLCNTFGVEFVEVSAAYSSIIGNFIHGSGTTPDPVAASIEIARRGYHKFQKGWLYPGIVSVQRMQQVLGNQWKEELGLGYMSWKGLAGKIKESKLKYRFPLNPQKAVFRVIYQLACIVVNTYTPTSDIGDQFEKQETHR